MQGNTKTSWKFQRNPLKRLWIISYLLLKFRDYYFLMKDQIQYIKGVSMECLAYIQIIWVQFIDAFTPSTGNKCNNLLSYPWTHKRHKDRENVKMSVSLYVCCPTHPKCIIRSRKNFDERLSFGFRQKILDPVNR